MDGILCIDKPEGFTSHDVVAKCRGILGTRKIGHGGTLDPIATGVLPLFIGNATKACDILPVQDKRYTASFELGIVTNTQDITGQVLSRSAVNIGRPQMEETINSFIGRHEQLPPMYSAIRVDGRRLYDLARQGVEIEREPRPVNFHSIKLMSWDESTHRGEIDVHCSRGTYIRTLCHDIGQALGCGAAMTALRRTESCGFMLKDCITLDEVQGLKDNGMIEGRLLPVQNVFIGYPRLDLDKRQTKMFSDGLKLSLKRLGLLETQDDLAVYGADGGFLGIAEPRWETDDLVMTKWFGIR